MNFIVKNISEAPKHHFFGFHDLIQSNFDNTKVLSLESTVINRPPLPGEKIALGFIDNNTHNFIELGKTNAFNYPQGARQQWLKDFESFLVNNQIGKDWGSEIYDTTIAKKIETLNKPIHCITKNNKSAFGINYARLHRLGGYGYIGVEDTTINSAVPSNDGIFIIDINSGMSKLLLSILEVAEFDAISKLDLNIHHYITHLRLSPNDSRIAFLHRYFLPDGGFMTRLMTIGIDGSNLRVLGSGFLSHFDWLDSNHLIIYGRANRSIDNLRNNFFITNPLAKFLLKQIKNSLRRIISNFSGQMTMSFLQISDSDNPDITPFAKEFFTEDGHPMVNPMYPKWIVNDTYPNKDNIRKLILYNYVLNKNWLIGNYGFSDKNVDFTLKDQFFKGIDKNILKNINPSQTAFFRSGLHCDLHPRWFADGRTIAFDSIHEGTRQIYSVDVSKIIEN